MAYSHWSAFKAVLGSMVEQIKGFLSFLLKGFLRGPTFLVRPF